MGQPNGSEDIDNKFSCRLGQDNKNICTAMAQIFGETRKAYKQ